MMRQPIYLIVLLAFPVLLEAQVTLSVEDAIERVGVENPEVHLAESNTAIESARVVEAKEWWLPSLSAGVDGHGLTGTDMNTDGQFFQEINRGYITPNIALEATWAPGKGVYKTRYARKQAAAANKHEQVVSMQEKQKVVEAYYEWWQAYLKRSIYEELVSYTASITGQLKIQVEKELQYESELLITKSKLQNLKMKLLEMDEQYQQSAARMKTLLGYDQSEELVPAREEPDTVQLQEGLDMEVPQWDEMEHPVNAFFEQEQAALETRKKGLNKELLIPELSLQAGTGYFGNMVDVFDPTAGFTAALRWNVPLGRLITKGEQKVYDQKLAKSESQQSYMNAGLEEEYKVALESYQMAAGHLKQGQEAVEMAEQALQQITRRQRAGTATALDVLQIQQEYLEVKLVYVQLIARYNRAQYMMEVISGDL